MLLSVCIQGQKVDLKSICSNNRRKTQVLTLRDMSYRKLWIYVQDTALKYRNKVDVI